VSIDEFHRRIEAVRRRFASSLERKISETAAQLAVTGEGAAPIAAVEASYRCVHEICGVSAAIGFVETGHAAKRVEDVLIVAYRARRVLAPDEIAPLRNGLAALQAAAAAELAASGMAPAFTPEG
jgi:HPt (histidine-containing phosphotransfer) domain-containing protein